MTTCTTATSGPHAAVIPGAFVGCLAPTLRYAEALVKDIPADRFAHMPHPGMNHPAFCMGHLSTYPDKILQVIGRPDLTAERPDYEEMFSFKARCVEQEGLYPPKDEIVSHYFERHLVVRDAVMATSDEVFTRENPMEGKMRELFPTIGIMVNFMLNNHNMMHLGQISAWRRAIGLGPAM